MAQPRTVVIVGLAALWAGCNAPERLVTSSSRLCYPQVVGTPVEVKTVAYSPSLLDFVVDVAIPKGVLRSSETSQKPPTLVMALEYDDGTGKRATSYSQTD